jgi:hypothetical protein
MEAFNSIIRDYNKQHLFAKPRDFNADLPILQALGANTYDQLANTEAMQLTLHDALTKWVKDWKTVDKSRINYLMKYGIVYEIMKVEERKAIRREIAYRP